MTPLLCWSLDQFLILIVPQPYQVLIQTAASTHNLQPFQQLILSPLFGPSPSNIPLPKCLQYCKIYSTSAPYSFSLFLAFSIYFSSPPVKHIHVSLLLTLFTTDPTNYKENCLHPYCHDEWSVPVFMILVLPKLIQMGIQSSNILHTCYAPSSQA